MTKLTASLLTTLLVSVDAASLRAADSATAEQPKERKLQLATTIFNALVDEFTPDLSTWLQTELNAFDPMIFGQAYEVSLGNTTFEGACPGSYANLTYGIGSIRGVSDVNIHKIELLDGTQEIEVSFMGLEGATWGGDWIFDFSFPAVVAETTVILNASLCGFPINQAVQGTTTISDPAIVSTVRMEGETSNILFFGSSSQVTSAAVQSAELSIGNVTADFGVNGNIVQNLNVAESLEQQVLTTFSDSIEPLMINVANVFLTNLAPFQINTGSGDSTVEASKKSEGQFELP